MVNKVTLQVKVQLKEQNVMLKIYLKDVFQKRNRKKWSNSLRFAQLMNNRVYHYGKKHKPYETMFGRTPKIGLTSL